MKPFTSIALVPITLVSIALCGLPEARAAGLGSIRGVIRDAVGNPLAGAAIFVVAETDKARSEKVVKQSSTDSEGRFIARGISPGNYLVKAQAAGFQTVELAAMVRPNKVTVFDSILLRRSETLSEQTGLNADPKYATRSARGTIFHYDAPATDDAKATQAPVPLTGPGAQTHGFVQTFNETTPGSGDHGSPVSSDFAVSQLLGRGASMVVSGQVGVGDNSPQRLETRTTAGLGDRHKVSVAFGYGRFTISRHGEESRLGQVSMSATDTWQVSGPVLVVYGLEFARFAEGGSGTSVLPRLGIAVDAGSHTRLFAGLEPGASLDSQSRIKLESGEITLPEQRPVACGLNNEPLLDRSYRVQVGGEQILSEVSSVEVMAFLDTISGHSVGLLALPSDRTGIEPLLKGQEQSGQSRGVRVVYHRRLNKILDGSIGYSFGQGQRFDSRGISDPASLFTNGLFQMVSAKIDASFASTGTRISTVVRLAPSRAVFAIDPFQGQMTTYDPNISVLITQELPTFGFIPGQWTAIVDLRNLLDQQATISDDRQELIASRFHRLVRVGVSLRF
jgi:hypothetical protein